MNLVNKLKQGLLSIWQDKLLLISAVGLSIKVVLFYLFLGKGLFEVKSLFVTLPGTILMLFSFVFLFKTWSRKSVIILINVVATFLLLAQMWYIRYFGTPLSFFAVLQTSNLSGLGPSIRELMNGLDILFIVDIILLFVLVKKKSFSIPKIHWRTFIIVFLAGFCILAVKPMKNHYIDGAPFAQIFKIYDRYDYMMKFNPLQYSALDLYLFYQNNRYMNLSDEERQLVEDWYKQKDQFRKEDKDLHPEYKGIAEGKNLILIQAESLENWVIGQKINGKEITPNLNRLLEHSVYASNFYPQTKGGRSSDAEFILNTSMLPVAEGSTFFRYPTNDYTTLPGLLKEKGYSTVAFHGDEGTYWNRREAYPHLGIDKYYDIEDLEEGEHIGMGLSDVEFFKQSVDILSKKEDPFYGLMITLTSHTPFILPDTYRELEFESQYSETSAANYLQTIHYLDMAIGKMLADLEERGMMDDTIVAIYGDHAGFENSYKEKMMKENPKVEGIDELGRVPFIIYNPEFEKLEITKAVGQVDMYPTLAYMLGIPEEKYDQSITGRNILTTKESFAVIPLENKIIMQNEADQAHKEFELRAQQVSDLVIRSNFFEEEEE
ncbi:LTA synthase family protein [Rossellomorea vietnamensis]|uniref:LTA synthase family protein n=1 Tax=Rossellomorea vietnamensis TaxID=218284 RepID=UPI000558DDD7|nr:LTA synthase family protein [Rossellomorea vietnamensis]